ncbi:glutaminyl-peptide cyclotransferase [Thiohalocapsa marina]|uniref:Glutaminyl-peptide cyclotransferase n=1 Tax=Thiohalocapsa marina TaxID=424902 RepID=A0A5M8FK61_9GAMM|nr:glutaminyl-peptide cyclotransferase [Thiohalocapsa marina]
MCSCIRRGLLSALLTGLLHGVAAAADTPPAPAPVQGYRVVASYPHDPSAFTQGLAFHDGALYESTGLYGRSTLRRVELASGRVLQQVALPDTMFGEGITVWRDEIVQLTWRAHRGLRFDRASLRQSGEFHLPGEGWGLTHDGRRWIVSDGTADLRFLDPQTQREVRRVQVQDAGRPLRRLNELEFIDGEVWANIWHDDRLVRISPADGRVLGYVDLQGLRPEGLRRHREAVLNGIAYDVDRGRLLVTGKYWPWLYHIEPMPLPSR